MEIMFTSAENDDSYKIFTMRIFKRTVLLIIGVVYQFPLFVFPYCFVKVQFFTLALLH